MGIKIHKKLNPDTLSMLAIADYKPIMKGIVKKVAAKFTSSEVTIPIYLNIQHTYADKKVGLIMIFGKPTPVWKAAIKSEIKAGKKFVLVGQSFISVDDNGNKVLNIMPNAGSAPEVKINKAGKKIKILNQLGLSGVNIIGELSEEASGDTDGDGHVNQGEQFDHDKALAEYVNEFKLLVGATKKFKKDKQPQKIKAAIASLKVVIEKFNQIYANVNAETKEKYAAAKTQIDKVSNTLAGGSKKEESAGDKATIVAKMNTLAERMKKLKAKIGNLDVLFREAS